MNGDQADTQMTALFSTIGVPDLIYLALMTGNAIIAAAAGDWRMRRVALLYFAMWIVTFIPYTEILVSPVSFVILSRIQLRRPGEVRLCWWMVPVIAAEAGIFVSHMAYLSVGYDAYWLLVQFFFLVQLLVALSAGLGRYFARCSQPGAQPKNQFAFVRG